MSGLTDRVVIAGGGLAAVRTAQALRELQYRGRIVILSDEVRLSYDRPPLSKNYLQGKVDDAQIRLMTARELEELRIAVRLCPREFLTHSTARRCDAAIPSPSRHHDEVMQRVGPR